MLHPNHIPGLGYMPVRRTSSGHHVRTLQWPSSPSPIDPASDQILTHQPCQASLPSTPPRRQATSSSYTSPSPPIGRRVFMTPRRRDPSPSMSKVKHRSTKEAIRWSLEPVYTSKNDAPKGDTTQERHLHRSIDLKFPSKVADRGLELLHGDAFKKGTI